MSHFELNLAREYTMDRTKRRRSYWLMVFYLGLCGILLIDTAYRTSKTVAVIRSCQAHALRLQQDFAKKYPTEPILTECIERAERTLGMQKQKLDLLLRETHEATPLGECLYRFAGDLPPSMRLANLSIDPSKASPLVTATFCLPAGKKTQDTPLECITRWKEDPEMSHLLKNIVLANRNDNALRNGERLTEFSCTAELIKGVSQ